MKKLLQNKKIMIIIIAVLALLVSACVALFFLGNRNVDDVIDYLKREVYSQKLEDLGDPNKDIGVRIMDCDSLEAFKDAWNVKITNRPGKYVQGTGAFTNMKYQTDLVRGVLKQPVDISDYAEGSIHISLYVEKKSALTDMIHFELSSMGAPDADELEWFIPLSKMKEGWNEYYLAIPGAFASGKLDLTCVNFFRVFSPNPKMGVNVALDDVYATKTEGVIYQPESSALKPVTTDSYKETEAKDGKMIMSCNTVNIFDLLGNVEVTVTPGELVEGTGAFKTVGYQDSLGEGVFTKPIDISTYKNGYVHVSLYVNQVSKLKDNVWFELTSGGACDVDEYSWEISKTQLKDGWNELFLPFSSASAYGKPDASAINFFRFFTLKQAEGLVTIFDNVYATNKGATDTYKETVSPNGKMIMSCNTVNHFSVLENMVVTTEKNEYVEGSGALRVKDTKQAYLGRGALAKPVDISAYKNGSIHLSLYINKPELLKEPMQFELTSSATWDKDEYEWSIPVSSLKTGWNEIVLPISAAEVTGKPALSSIDYFRIYTLKQKAGLTIILDNVYAMKGMVIQNTPNVPNENGGTSETTSPYGKMIMSCNTTSIFSTLENMTVTNKVGEYVEGTGALKTDNAQDAFLGRGTFANPIDISDYAGKYIHISLYINQISLINGDTVFELSSSGTWDKDEYSWVLSPSQLKSGWNELYLPLETAIVEGSPNLKAINYFRLFTLEQKAGLSVILDNVYATKTDGMKTACGESLKAGDVMLSNCLCYYSNYFNMGLTTNCKEGAYALQAKNPSTGIYGTFKTKVDIASYKKGSIHIWVYVNDCSYLNKDMTFELSSSGTCNKNEYEWTIQKKDLKTGWNEFTLAFEDAYVTGKPDLANINYFRLFTASPDTNLKFALDDVYATLSK